jgi:hypothetical protein
VGNKVANGLIGHDQLEGFQKENGTYFFITNQTIKGPMSLSKNEVAENLVLWFEGNKTW